MATPKNAIETSSTQTTAQTNSTDANALFKLGLKYFQGKDVPKDDKKAVEFLQQAATLGQVEAQYILACTYEEGGLGITQDYKKAADLLQKAADQGHVEAQYRLAEFFKVGRGVAQDMTKAILLYEQAAKQGHITAQFYVGLFYFGGRGVEKDQKKGIEFLEQAAKQNHAEAQCVLGSFYWSGINDDDVIIVQQDYHKAYELFQQSAKNGSVNAKTWLGRVYESGNVVPQDFKKACELYQQVINECGDMTCLYRLGLLYLSGRGVEKDLNKAYELLQKAAEKGHREAPLYFYSTHSTETKENAGTSIKTIKSYRALIEEPRRTYIKHLLRNGKLQTIIDQTFMCSFPEIYGLEGTFNCFGTDLHHFSIGLHHRDPGSLNNINIHDLILFFQYCTFLSSLAPAVVGLDERRSLSFEDDLTPLHASARSIMLTHSEYVKIFEIPMERDPLKCQAINDFIQLFQAKELFSVKNIGVSMNSNDVLLPLLPVVSHLDLNLDLVDVEDPEPPELTQQQVQRFRAQFLANISALKGQKSLKTLTINLSKSFHSTHMEFDTDGYAELLVYLQKNPVSKGIFNKGVLTELGKSISESSIEGLRMPYFPLGSFPIDEVLGFLHSLKKSKLVYLDLSNSQMSSSFKKEDFLRIAAALSELSLKERPLKYLNLSYNGLSDFLTSEPASEPGKQVMANPDHSFLFQLGRLFRNIEKLDLSYNFMAAELYPVDNKESIETTERLGLFALGLSGGTIKTLLLNGALNIILALRWRGGNTEGLFKDLVTYQNNPNYEAFKNDLFEFFTTLFEKLRLSELGLNGTHLCHLLKSEDWNHLLTVISRSELNTLLFNGHFRVEDKAMAEAFCSSLLTSKSVVPSFDEPYVSFVGDGKEQEEETQAREMLRNLAIEFERTSNPKSMMQAFEARMNHIKSILLEIKMHEGCVSLVAEYCGENNVRNGHPEAAPDLEQDEASTPPVATLMFKYFGLSHGEAKQGQDSPSPASSIRPAPAGASLPFIPLFNVVDVQTREEVSKPPAKKSKPNNHNPGVNGQGS